MRVIWGALLSLNMLVLAGCATTGGTNSAFTDSEAADAASIKGRWKRESAFVWEGYSLLAIDDKFVTSPLADRQEHVSAKVSPGSRKLAVKVVFNRGLGSGPLEGFVPVTAELKPSVNYRINGKVTGTAVEAWLEDSATNERVSEVGRAPFQRHVQAATIPIIIPAR
jgi:predicted ribosomally synthesized peptide with SipW-like signal peptide